MIPITFFRSSSYVGWDYCPQSYYLGYVLGIPSPANPKAVKGTMTHKALECLARAKWCKQNGQKDFEDDALGKVFLEDCVPNLLADRAFDFYSKQETHLEFGRKDRSDVKEWLWKTLTLQGGRFDPRKIHIVEPEIHFDIEFPYEWAHYSFETAQGKLEGQLRLKGTSDLVVQLSPGVYECRDYKTGKFWNWGKMKAKTYKHLCNDPQLRIYHYAVSKKFPDIDCVMTIIYMNDGGSFTVCFGKEDLVRTEAMIRQQFNRIRNTVRPRLDKGFKCTSFCHYGKTKRCGDPQGRSICEFIKDEYITKGQRYVESNYTHPGFKIGFYAAPGATK